MTGAGASAREGSSASASAATAGDATARCELLPGLPQPAGHGDDNGVGDRGLSGDAAAWGGESADQPTGHDMP